VIGSLQEAVDCIAAASEGAHLDLDARRILTWLADRAESLSATRHPLGFAHVELTPIVPGLSEKARVRLHIWLDAINGPDELGSIHDHVWMLKSCVLTGTLIDVTLDPIPRPEGEYIGFRVKYGYVNQFDIEGHWHLSEWQRRRIEAGQVYSLPPRTVHKTEVQSIPLVTLLVTADDDDGEKGPVVYSRHAESAGTSVRPGIPSAVLASMLNEICDKI
jgi:hypothetical protein